MMETLIAAVKIRGVIAVLTKPLRGVVDVVYVAAHWGEISQEREQYRRQIKDRKEWADAMLRQKDALHAVEKERIASALANMIAARDEVEANAVSSLERAVEQMDRYDTFLQTVQKEHERTVEALRTKWKETLADVLNATTLLAMMLSFEPREQRMSILGLLGPRMAGVTNAMVEGIEAGQPAPDFPAIRVQALREIVGAT